MKMCQLPPLQPLPDKLFFKSKLTPPEVAKLWGITSDKVVAFIKSGELKAMNAATPGRNQRPRYLIDWCDLEDFEKRRAVVPPKRLPRRRNKPVKKHPDDRY